MSSDLEDEKDETERLRREVYLAAQSLLSRGIRPSLMLIEGEVSGSKKQLDRWLREWTEKQDPKSNYYADPLLLVDRTRDPLIGPGNTVATRRAAAAQREEARQRADADELNREIEQARQRLTKLQSGRSNSARKVRPETLEKARVRLETLEKRRALADR